MRKKKGPPASSAATLMRPLDSNGMALSTSTAAAGPRQQALISRSTNRGYRSMNMMNELTIVIPAKNEAKLLPSLLNSLVLQDYPLMSNTKVYLADAGSTDGTPEIARSYAEWLDIEVIAGGLPAVGRNNGARRARTPYVLFLDADIELGDLALVRRAVECMKLKNLHCVTTNIACPTGTLIDKTLYTGNNLM